MSTTQEEIINERATQLEGIGFKLEIENGHCIYRKGDIKMIPTLMMCAPTPQWDEFISKNTDVAVPIVAQETELQMWKAKAEGNEIIAIERGKAIEELQKQISEKDEELRKAKIYIEALATADMKQIEFWQKFKTEHNL